ncbi:MAG: tRNA uridine-5-carboxymethylaminomethyl(34) synthesis GTPase MnmE [Clostridia bacterium]|jgi:tRNA modification GTPase|nr:tRNA uridine-5-carboxymethylaminomethyl(34) synthesis GTPase MnmE [Clostridia bacterium]
MTDTIAAISTALGGGIAIVRISGDKSFDVIEKIFKSNKDIKKIESNSIVYGYIVDPKTGETVDEVLVSFLKGPNTYTKEDIIEINTHGGAIPTRKVLETIINNGARLAEPGEFTKRAFLNGRIDLSQAEAIMDIIMSKTDLSLKNAVSHLSGSLSDKIKGMRNEILHLIANIEVSIDYPEHDMEDINFENVKTKCIEIDSELNKFIENAETGRIMKEGIRTVIVGKPNVGKSSLLNEILKENRAIVTDIEGTTRDTLEEFVNVRGIPLHIIDTAGIRDTEDVVEKIGVEKSKDIVESADLVLLVLDASKCISKEDKEIIEIVKDKNTIVILNKSDLERKIDLECINIKDLSEHLIETSMLDKTGIDKLENLIKDMFFEGKIEDSSEAIYVTNMRHKKSLVDAKQSVKEVIMTINNNMPEDLMAIDLKNAYEKLGEITGDTVSEDIIDTIFSEFCLGK